MEERGDRAHSCGEVLVEQTANECAVPRQLDRRVTLACVSLSSRERCESPVRVVQPNTCCRCRPRVVWHAVPRHRDDRFRHQTEVINHLDVDASSLSRSVVHRDEPLALEEVVH